MLSPTIFVNAASMMPPQTLYLGIKVNTDPELSPRQPLLSVPYAMVASNAIGDITPKSVSVNGKTVIDSMGNWKGPPTGVMASGVKPVAFQGAPIAVGMGVDNHQWAVSLSAAQLGAATQCLVTATGNVCGYNAPAINTLIVTYAASRPTGGAALDSTQGAWLPAPFANTANSGYTCSASTTSFTFPVTAGSAYDFGCDFTAAVAIAGSSSTNVAGGAYCQASVQCF
jgi:hypothetical protein